MDAPRDFLIFYFLFFIFSPNEQRAGGGGGGALPDFFLFLFFPVQQTTSGIGHRVKYSVVFFGLATNALNVRNNNKQQPAGHFCFIFNFLVRKIPFAGIELTSQRVTRLHGYL